MKRLHCIIKNNKSINIDPTSFLYDYKYFLTYIPALSQSIFSNGLCDVASSVLKVKWQFVFKFKAMPGIASRIPQELSLSYLAWFFCQRATNSQNSSYALRTLTKFKLWLCCFFGRKYAINQWIIVKKSLRGLFEYVKLIGTLT